jgi:hypothetical protein
MAAKYPFACVASVIVGLIVTLPGYVAIDPENVVGAWLFDEGEGEVLEDISGNGHDGIIVGKPKWVDSNFGKALEFNGQGEVVEVPGLGLVGPTTEVTIVTWGHLPEARNQDMFTFDPLVGDNRITIHLPWDNTVIWQHGTDQHAAWAPLPQEAVGKWTHWAFVGSAKQNFLKILRDGELFTIREDEPTAKPAFRASDQTWSIAGRKGLSYAGAIDEVALFNIALGDEDIKRIMDEGLEGAIFGAAVSPLGKLATTWSRIKAQD